MDPATILSEVLELLGDEGVEATSSPVSERPCGPIRATPRRYTHRQRLELFQRDRFTDRYSGQRLVFPGTLRLLSHLLPEAFPYHPNWKLGRSFSRVSGSSTLRSR